MNRFPFEVVGHSRRALVVEVTGHGRCFIGTKNVATLCNDSTAQWKVITQPSHEDPRTGRMFPETKWVAVAHWHIL